jgi:hypothetical protein
MSRIHVALVAAPALLLFSTQDAHAYLDPGTGSMILQGLIGGIAGGMFAIRLYWGKLKGRFGRMQTSHTGAENTDDKAP